MAQPLQLELAEHSGAGTADGRLPKCPSKLPSTRGRHRRPPVIYTDEQMNFIWHRLNYLGETWKRVYEIFFEQYPSHQKQHLNTIRVRYYAFLKRKGYPPVREKNPT